MLLRDALAEVGMTTLVKSTGSKGLHVTMPIDGTEDFYLSAQTAMQRPGPNRDYYLKKRHHGRTHSQAVSALARRRVDVLWALLRDNRTWTLSPPAAAQAA
jgi:hypothetical protein